MKFKLLILILSNLLFTFAQANTFLVTDQDYLPTLLNELGNAKNNIDILAFSFAVDNGQGQIQPTNPAFTVAQKLIDLKKEKGNSFVIRLYIEGERSTLDRNLITGKLLEKAGILVKYGSTHAKGFSIDHQKIFFGSTNLTTQSMMKNNETNILSDDPLIIKGFDQFFENLYNKGKEESLILDKPMLADSAYKSAILKAIQLATKSLEFSIYYFNDSDIENELIKASQRGVKIRGYLNQRELPGSNLVEKNRQTVERLKKAGITELYFALDNSFTHSKYIICDKEKIFLGTGNWNYSDVNNYRQLYVELNSTELSLKLSDHLAEQIKLESN
jgi:phosphatidylserine/phosphatidylglycerophosphate/cardiolipin synthase-like enzyme